MIMDCRLYALSVLTFVALKISYASTEPSERDTSLDDPTRLDTSVDDIRQLYAVLPDDAEAYEKRRSLMRFGKRRSLMRFGKRGSILRFGKRSSLMRFGKRNSYDSDETDAYAPELFYDFPGEYTQGDDYGDVKRGSLMRFGKKSSIMRFGRSIAGRTANGKPHTPWRFGREEEDELL